MNSPNTPKRSEQPLAESTLIGQNEIYRKRRTTSPLPNKNQQKMKIDSHVMTDAKSNGIVSRLVKYYDQSQTDAAERSRIVYNKVGDFPLVQLKKSEIKRPISKTTSVRIAAPNKTIMNRDMRAAIMRSNSFQFASGIPKIQPVKMKAKDDSHQIITNHEEAYPVTSNSVLDALEKNCRKRINNEELILDRSKKFCPPAPIFEQQIEVAPSLPPVPPISAKRTREPASPNKSSSAFDFQQRAKKFKTRNNALLSSLSSSHQQLLSSTPSSPKPREKVNQTKLVPKLNFTQSPVTSKPQEKEKEKTPVEEEKIEKEVIDAPQELPTAQIEGPKRLQLFNRKPDDNAISNRARFRLIDSDEEEEIHSVKFVRPREQTISETDERKELEKAKLEKMLTCLTKGTESPFKPKEKSKDTVDAEEKKEKEAEKPVASISFSTSTTSSIVAPIPSSGVTVTSSNTASVQSTSNSSGFQLSTGIALTASKPEDKKTETLPTLQLPKTTEMLKVVTSEKSETTQSSSGGLQFSFGAPQKSDSIPLLQTKAPISFGNLPAVTKANESEKSSVTEKPAAPSLGGFQFGLSTPKTTTVTHAGNLLSVSTASTKPVSPLALFSTSSTPSEPQKTGIVPKIDAPTTVASGIGFSFGSKPTTAAETSTSVTPTVSFNFGAKPAQPVATTAPPSFNFGSTSSITTTAQQPSQVESKPSFSFGGSALGSSSAFAKPDPLKTSFSSQPASSTPIFGQTAATTTSGFSFGASTVTTTSSSTFGQLGATTTFSSLNAVPSTSPPTFGSISSSVVTTTASSTSIFGSVNTTTASQPSVFGGFQSSASATQSPFGSNTTSSFETAKSSFSFGSATPSPAVTTSANIFGTSTQSTAKSAFNFGSNTATTQSAFGSSSVTSQPTFGGITSSQEKPAFNFGSSTNKPSFGAPPAVASAPVFGSTQSPFGSSQESQKPAFNFQNPNSSFSFNKPQEAPSPFGAPQPQATENKPAFNFTQSAPQLPQSPQQAGGLFSIGTGANQRKPFRTAARRMK